MNWAFVFNHRVSPIAPADVWREIKALWATPSEDFVCGLYEVLLGRPPEPSALATLCAALENDGSRFALTRTIALSDEAMLSHLDLSWLPELDAVESEAVWKKLQLLWSKPDRVFVASLYPLLLVRPPEWKGVAAHCRAMKAGTSRADVVRAIALSDEAQRRGLSVAWLPRLETLPAACSPQRRLVARLVEGRFPPLAQRERERFVRRWSGNAEKRPELVGAAAEGGES